MVTWYSSDTKSSPGYTLPWFPPLPSPLPSLSSYKSNHRLPTPSFSTPLHHKSTSQIRPRRTHSITSLHLTKMKILLPFLALIPGLMAGKTHEWQCDEWLRQSGVQKCGMLSQSTRPVSHLRSDELICVLLITQCLTRRPRSETTATPSTPAQEGSGADADLVGLVRRVRHPLHIPLGALLRDCRIVGVDWKYRQRNRGRGQLERYAAVLTYQRGRAGKCDGSWWWDCPEVLQCGWRDAVLLSWIGEGVARGWDSVVIGELPGHRVS